MFSDEGFGQKKKFIYEPSCSEHFIHSDKMSSKNETEIPVHQLSMVKVRFRYTQYKAKSISHRIFCTTTSSNFERVR